MKTLEEEVKRLRNESSATEQRKALEILRKLCRVTRNIEIPYANSLAEMYHNNTVRRQSVILLGKEVAMDEWLDWRVKWGQRGTGVFFLLRSFVTVYPTYRLPH